MTPLDLESDAQQRREHYAAVQTSIDALLEDQTDWIAAMATVACELHHAFTYFHWTGFYRAVTSDLLVVGPYQGSHGCLSISFARGVCGAAARTRKTQLVLDVDTFPDHIACSSATRSEVVVPILTPQGRLLGVLDVDSNDPAAFTAEDASALEILCADLGLRFEKTSQL